MLGWDKAIATVTLSANSGQATATVKTIGFRGYNGVRGSATGLRQVASVDGSGFWIAGIASQFYGIRYLDPTKPTELPRVHGSQPYPDGHYLPGTVDIRGIGINSGRLIMTSAFITEPNLQPKWSSWGGLIKITGQDGGLTLPTSVTSSSSLMEGFTGRRNLWSFVFEKPMSVFIIQDRSVYQPASNEAAAAFDAQMGSPSSAAMSWRPVNVRVSVACSIAHFNYINDASRWIEDLGTRVNLPGGVALYSLTGRVEGGVWTLYSASRSSVFRVVPSTRAVTTLASAEPGTFFRGVVLPPRPQAVSPSGTGSRTDTPAATASRSRSGKPR